jgi:hypothetical protein
MKVTVFWDIAPCGLVEVYRRFRGGTASIIRAQPDDGGYIQSIVCIYHPQCSLHALSI